jgi:hypothetical protein
MKVCHLIHHADLPRLYLRVYCVYEAFRFLTIIVLYKNDHITKIKMVILESACITR